MVLTVERKRRSEQAEIPLYRWLVGQVKVQQQCYHDHLRTKSTVDSTV